MSDELKTCPFCGGEAEMIEARPEDNNHILFRHFGVACKECRTMIGTLVHNQTDFYDSPDEAKTAWNTRAVNEAWTADEYTLQDGKIIAARFGDTWLVKEGV